jgi:hypothetical protein
LRSLKSARLALPDNNKMARDQTIKDVSKTLLDLLKTNLSDIPSDLVSPKNAGTNVLTLFLYKVLENPDFKNADSHQLTANAQGRLVEARKPLIVDLYYLLTAHLAETTLLEAHRALSRAMRVFYDNGILRGSLLSADPSNRGLTADSTLRLTLNPITMEDLTRIWSVFPDTPYEISVTYLVTPVAIESERVDESAPVVDQLHEQGQRGAELRV